jgi:hypothetical protein
MPWLESCGGGSRERLVLECEIGLGLVWVHAWFRGIFIRHFITNSIWGRLERH